MRIRKRNKCDLALNVVEEHATNAIVGFEFCEASVFDPQRV